MENRRRFDRIAIPENAQLRVLDKHGKTLGPVRVLGRGGMQFESAIELETGKSVPLKLQDDAETFVCDLTASVRDCLHGMVGCEFENLDQDTATEIGICIGKYIATRP